MSEGYYAVIMAGGGGTRLWPLSRRNRPKQMLHLVDHRTLFQIAVQRLDGLFPPERILVVTTADQAPELQAQSPEIPAHNFILEPRPRGTAAAIGLSAVVLQKRDPGAVMAVLTADHYLRDEALFRRTLAAAREVALEGYLVTLGIRPTSPATGYGYIQQGKSLGAFDGFEAYHALRFKEKPDLETAREMLESGDHAWNSGMFIWRTERILEEFERQMPELHAVLGQIAAAWDSPEEQAILQRVWLTLKTETIDYGVMEHAERVAVIPAGGLGWNDVGSWGSLFQVLPADEDGNIVHCERHLNVNSRNSLVHADEGAQRLIVTVGVEDLVIVDTGDVLLVCSKDQAQDVRQVVQLLKENEQDRYL